MKTTQYRATFTRQGQRSRTRFYASKYAAQEALWMHHGKFEYIGHVGGDGIGQGGNCMSAPRNGGIVTLETRELNKP